MSNKKKNRTKGTIPSLSREFPNPMTSNNNISTAENDFSDKERLQRNSKANRFC